MPRPRAVSHVKLVNSEQKTKVLVAQELVGREATDIVPNPSVHTHVAVVEDRSFRGPHVFDDIAAPSQICVLIAVSCQIVLNRQMIQIIIRPGHDQTELPPNVRQGALKGR